MPHLVREPGHTAQLRHEADGLVVTPALVPLSWTGDEQGLLLVGHSRIRVATLKVVLVGDFGAVFPCEGVYRQNTKW